MRKIAFGFGAAILALAASTPASAQQGWGRKQSSAELDDAWRKSMPDPATIAMPRLDFTATVADELDYDKYYYFHRASTSFPDALTDLRDCDELSRGLRTNQGGNAAMYANGGLVGGLVGNLLAIAIFGSSEKRRVRRVNMRRCMHYKGYARFGLSKALWDPFNFEEGFSGLDEPKRQGFLFQQAKVASGPAPTGKELGL